MWNDKLPLYVRNQLDDLVGLNCMPIATMIHEEYEALLNKLLEEIEKSKSQQDRKKQKQAQKDFDDFMKNKKNERNQKRMQDQPKKDDEQDQKQDQSKADGQNQKQDQSKADGQDQKQDQSKADGQDQKQDQKQDQSKADGQGQSKADGQDQSKADGQDQSKADGQDQSKADGQDQSKADGQDQSKADGQDQSKADGQDQSKADGQDQSKADGQDQSKADGQNQKQDQSKADNTQEGSNDDNSNDDNNDPNDNSSTGDDSDMSNAGENPSANNSRPNKQKSQKKQSNQEKLNDTKSDDGDSDGSDFDDSNSDDSDFDDSNSDGSDFDDSNSDDSDFDDSNSDDSDFDDSNSDDSDFDDSNGDDSDFQQPFDPSEFLAKDPSFDPNDLSELTELEKEEIEKAIKNTKFSKEAGFKVAMMHQLNKQGRLLNMPEEFKKLLWNVPKLLGATKQVMDGLQRGLPSSTFGEEMLATRGKFVKPRLSRFALEYEISPILALHDVAENKAPVFRAKESKGNGDFIMAVDLSGSMTAEFEGHSIQTIDLARVIAICMYSIKKTHIYGWGEYPVIFNDVNDFAQRGMATQNSTTIRSCLLGLRAMLEKLKADGELKKGTDLVILTDGEPSERTTDLSIEIQNIIESNKGIVWLIHLYKGSIDRQHTITDAWRNLYQTYIPITQLSDVENIVPIMKKSLRKIK